MNTQSGRELKPKPRKKTKWDWGSKAKASKKVTIIGQKLKPEASKTATVQIEEKEDRDELKMMEFT